MKYLKIFFGAALYTIILCCVWVIYIYFFKVNVVFYSALYSALIALVIYAVIVKVLPVYAEFSVFEQTQHLLFCAMLGYILAISVPTVIDRSLSFYILEKLQQRGGGIKQDQFEQIFTQEYAKEHRLVDVRLTEQLESGTIRIENGCVKLTDKGREIAAFSRAFRQHFLPKQRLLMGQYTDDLTNPFKNSASAQGYTCQ